MRVVALLCVAACVHGKPPAMPAGHACYLAGGFMLLFVDRNRYEFSVDDCFEHSCRRTVHLVAGADGSRECWGDGHCEFVPEAWSISYDSAADSIDLSYGGHFWTFSRDRSSC